MTALPHHTFLTGERGVGKSTLWRQYLAGAGLVADGFRTVWHPLDDLDASPRGDADLYLTSVSDDHARYLLATRRHGLVTPVPDVTAVFDRDGVEILASAGRRDVILMDEIGSLEAGAVTFQAAVLRLLEGDVPICGVLQAARRHPSTAAVKFAEVIQSMPTVTVQEVTKQNRDTVFAHWLSTGGC